MRYSIQINWARALALTAFAVMAACAHTERRELTSEQVEAARAGFEIHLTQLATALTIPGGAYAVVSDGRIVAQGFVGTDEGERITTETPLRFASVTKGLSAVLLMRAVERGALSLDDSAAKWLPEFSDRPQITVRHLAAHVSEGTPGAEYVYGATRYSKLGRIIASAANQSSFERVLRAELVEPLGMQWRESPQLGAQAGFVSTVADVSRFVAALQQGKLLTRKSFDTMTSPYRSNAGKDLPVGVGWFTQQIGGERIVWSFGQDAPDHSSALVLMLPQRKLALVLLANTDELSNPFRLLMGDVRYSPFATAFIDTFAPQLSGGIAERERTTTVALIELWRGEMAAAASAFARISTQPTTSDDLVLHFLAAAAADDATRGFAQSLDSQVVQAHPTNRWALLTSAGLHERFGNRDQAAACYESILSLPNQEPDGLAKLFRAWSYQGLATLYKDDQAARALDYVEQGLGLGVGGGTLEDLRALKNELTPSDN